MRKRLYTLLLLLLTLLFTGGCSSWRKGEAPLPQPIPDRPETVAMRETVFYFPDHAWEVVVPVRYAIPWTEGIARATLNLMIDGQVPREILDAGFSPLLPKGTKILGLTIRDGLARVDFNNALLHYDPLRARQLLGGLVYTLTEFPTVNRVEILVEGQKPVFLPGDISASEPFNREYGLNLEVTVDTGRLEQVDRVTLYFLHMTKKGEAFFVPVTRVVAQTDDLPRTTVEELLKGPSRGSVLYSAIPGGVGLAGVSVEGARAQLQLTGELGATGGGQLAADRIRDQLALTLTEIAGIDEIEVLSSGQPPRFPPGVDFPALLTRPKDWNKIGQQLNE